MIDIKKSVGIKGFPGYFVLDNKIWEIREAQGEKEAIEREILPNVNGKIALKDERKVPIPMMYQQVLDVVNENIEKLRKDQESKLDSGLDRTLVNKRLFYQIEMDKAFKKAKTVRSGGWNELQRLKEDYFRFVDLIEKFDKENPGYKPKGVISHKGSSDGIKEPETLDENQEAILSDWIKLKKSISDLELKRDSMNEKLVEVFGGIKEFKIKIGL